MSVISSFDVGTIARAIKLLEDMGVAPADIQAIIDDPLRRAVVAVAIRGELALPEFSVEDWIEREMAVGTQLSRYGFGAFSPDQVSSVSKGEIGPNHRFIPGNLTLETLVPFFYAWNNQADKEEGGVSIKLYHEVNEEWWRSNSRVECIPTEAGVISCDFSSVMRPTDLVGRPFNLNMDEQVAWAKQQGGSGIMSAEQVTYLFICSVIENQLPLWAVGSVRCRNACGSDRSLGVRWDAGRGFGVGDCYRSCSDWTPGAIPEVLQVLDA